MNRFYCAPPGFLSLTKKLAAISTECIQAELFSVGKSVLGRDLWAIGFGERRNTVLYAGGFHAQEWITVLLLVRLLEDIAAAVKNRACLCGEDLYNRIRHSGFIILPCVNPDGLELVVNGTETAGMYKRTVRSIAKGDMSGWNANIRGVDINHNFDAGFALVKAMEQENGIVSPAKRQYGGECPESEPETRAVCTLCRMYLPRRVIAFHSQGEEIYYTYGPNTPKSSRATAIQLSQLCGYTVCEPQGMASHGGFKDWFIEQYGKEGFTIEIGKGENPLPIEELPIIYENLKEMLVMGLLNSKNLVI